MYQLNKQLAFSMITVCSENIKSLRTEHFLEKKKISNHKCMKNLTVPQCLMNNETKKQDNF